LGALQLIEFTLLRRIDLCLTNVRCCWAGVQRVYERQQVVHPLGLLPCTVSANPHIEVRERLLAKELPFTRSVGR